MFLNFLEVSNHIVNNGGPHVFVSFLNFAVVAHVAVHNLISIKNVLPNVKEGVSVPEGEDDEGGVDAQNAFDVFFFLFDEMGVKGSVGWLAHIALPIQEIGHVVSADNHGVGQKHLLYVGEGAGKGN